VGLERGPLSLVSIIEELLERKSSGSGIENRGFVTLTTWHTLALTSPASDGRSLGIVRSQTQVTELLLRVSTLQEII
jgi:hypothetical protein